MEGRVESLSHDELWSLYRNAKGNFLLLHRLMIRLGLVGDRERIEIYDLTKKTH